MGPAHGAGFTLYQTKMEPETDPQKLGLGPRAVRCWGHFSSQAGWGFETISNYPELLRLSQGP